MYELLHNIGRFYRRSLIKLRVTFLTKFKWTPSSRGGGLETRFLKFQLWLQTFQTFLDNFQQSLQLWKYPGFIIDSLSSYSCPGKCEVCWWDFFIFYFLVVNESKVLQDSVTRQRKWTFLFLCCSRKWSDSKPLKLLLHGDWLSGDIRGDVGLWRTNLWAFLPTLFSLLVQIRVCC